METVLRGQSFAVEIPGVDLSRDLSNAEFDEIKRIWLERQHHAGAGRRAKRPDLTRFARLGQCLTREPMHGGGRIDPGLHIGEIFTDQGQDVTEIWIVRGVAFRREHALI